MIRTVGWAAALILVLVSGVIVAASFLAPGLALAGSLHEGAASARPWLVDGGSEVATDAPSRLEITAEYFAFGVAAIAISLRLGQSVLAKLQDWYEDAPSQSSTARRRRRA